MRFAIFSDVHANLEALDAVLADARNRKCTRFVCLGDVVGYNANPRECVQRVRELDCPVVKGNHDDAASRLSPPGDFNKIAERAIAWTRDHDFTIVHATLDTPGQWGYVFNNLDAAASFTYQHTNVCFFGHTHVPMVFVRDESVRRKKVEHVRIEPAKKYFINMGSVGQPRDGNWRAAYCIYDTENNLVQQFRIKYDLAAVQKKIAEAGLPRLLAERLAIGR